MRQIQHLQGLDLDNMEIQGAQFVNAHLGGSNFQNTLLIDIDFTGADLREVNFTNAQCIRVNFTNADLSGAILAGTQFDEDTVFTGARITVLTQCDVGMLVTSDPDPHPMLTLLLQRGAILEELPPALDEDYYPSYHL